MEKRVLIAVILSVAVMYGYSYLVPAPQLKTVGTTSAVQPAVSSSAVTAVKTVQPPAVPPVVAPARDVVVETSLFKAVFSSRGGSLKRLVLKNYREKEGPGGKEVTLIDENGPENFSLKSSSQGLPVVPLAACSVNSDGFTLGKGEKRDLEFTCPSPEGDLLKKTFTIHGDSYGMDLVQQITNTTPVLQSGSLNLELATRVDSTVKESRFDEHGPVSYVGKGVEALKLKDLAKGPKSFDKDVLWTGYADKYFLSAVIAGTTPFGQIVIREVNGHVDNSIASLPLTLKPGESSAFSYKLYFGPKDLDILKAQDNHLDAVVDLGWFTIVAKPLLSALKFFYGYVHNYGIAIIIVTVIIKILFYPLTYKSYKSMKQMQKIQPKMAELKEKYKNDRDAMNKAVMELYKTHKVNPLGGCLPMVVQMPIFIALYRALMTSIELRHAPFMLWILDLSAKDPFYVTPIIMGATMFIQQKMTPNTSMDPTQAKMMLALPLVFTVMFINMPAGLVLYWLVNNILTIAQQMYINKLLKE
jgi:YidC/Oxa1 family membrane protein insertase